MSNACVTAFNLFVKVKPFSTKAFVLIDFLEIRNLRIIELRFCLLKLNAYDRVASTPELGTNLIDCQHRPGMLWGESDVFSMVCNECLPSK